MKTTTLLSIFLATTMLGACGGGGDVTSKEVNPFANGNVPKEKESLRIISLVPPGLVIPGTYTFDPVEEKFSFKSDGDGFVFEGDYDPNTLTVQPTYCVTPFGSICPTIGEDNSVKDLFESFKGDGLVAIIQEEGSLSVLGYNPADGANLPSGRVTYNGEFVAHVDDGEEYQVTGDAQTIVNFNAGTLSAAFTNFSDERILEAGLENATLDGSTFSGGAFTFATVDGTLEGGITKTYGEFFGEEGQELGGVLSYGYYEDGREPSIFDTPDIMVEGAWTGAR